LALVVVRVGFLVRADRGGVIVVFLWREEGGVGGLAAEERRWANVERPEGVGLGDWVRGDHGSGFSLKGWETRINNWNTEQEGVPKGVEKRSKRRKRRNK
jgi:hypothetical protein